MTPKLSSYWLYFVTSTSFNLASALVSSMKIEVICRNNDLNKILGIEPIPYRKALEKTMEQIESHVIVSSWKDSLISSSSKLNLSEFINVPVFGCFTDQRELNYHNKEKTIERIWSIGGETGWYAYDFLWKVRGIMDQFVGGVGLRRGRTNRDLINVGDSVDLWRVIYADREAGRLLLFAEMKLPGEAWLEFKINEENIVQTATFRPRGLLGRVYWYAVLPFHGLVFNGMIRKLASK